MKKTLLFALVGIVLLAFTSCGPKGTKQFNESKATLEQIQKQVEAATTCDEMQMAALGILGIAFGGDEYAEEEKMTAEEQTTFTQMMDDLSAKMEAKSTELGCDAVEEDSIQDGTMVDTVATETPVVAE